MTRKNCPLCTPKHSSKSPILPPDPTINSLCKIFWHIVQIFDLLNLITSEWRHKKRPQTAPHPCREREKNWGNVSEERKSFFVGLQGEYFNVHQFNHIETSSHFLYIFVEILGFSTLNHKNISHFCINILKSFTLGTLRDVFFMLFHEENSLKNSLILSNTWKEPIWPKAIDRVQ